MYYEIQNIEPFNDIFYRSCFFNSFFSVIQHYGKCILPYLMHDTMIYVLDGGEDVLIKSEFAFLDKAELNIILTKQGIEMCTYVKQNDIISCFHENLRNDRPVILWIDAFYIPYRKDTYQKLHWPHTVLLYGYQEKDECVYVIDHTWRENLTYEKKKLTNRHLIESYDAYLANFLLIEQEPLSCYIFEERKGYENPENIKEYSDIFRSNLLKNRLIMQQSLEALQLFTNSISFDALISNNYHADRFVEGVNSIILNKELEIYRFDKFFTHMNNWINLQKKILDKWIAIRARLLKFIFSNRQDNELCRFLAHQMKCVLQEEYAVYKLLISSI